MNIYYIYVFCRWMVITEVGQDLLWKQIFLFTFTVPLSVFLPLFLFFHQYDQTPLCFPPAFHFKPSFPDEPVTSPTTDRSSMAKKRFTLQGFSNLKNPKGNISGTAFGFHCRSSVIVRLCYRSDDFKFRDAREALVAFWEINIMKYKLENQLIRFWQF